MPIHLLAIVGGIFVVGGFAQQALNVFPPLWTAWQKFAFSLLPNVNPQIAELVDMRWRGIIDEGEYYKRCEQWGFDNRVAGNLFDSSTTLLTMQDYIALWRRGEINESEVDDKLHSMHIDGRDRELAKAVTLFFPSAPDLIRFAVREVYTPEVLEKFGALADLPPQYLQEAGRAGLTEEHAKNYWAAHWELPSAQMGFEMFHRRIIDEDMLKLLLRSLDVMPFWRDALVKLSYNPLTRVDVRRMYRLGVLDEGEVYNSYLDIGYSPENAQRMLDFTVAYEADELTGVTRASVISSYQKGIITEGQLKKYLEGFGYTPEVVEFWLSMARYDKEMALIDTLVDEIRQQYITGMLTISQVRSELAKWDLPSSFISETITSFETKKSEKVKLPSRTDLENWLKAGLINDVEYSLRMVRLGYTQNDVELYLAEIAKEQTVEKVVYLPQKTYERWYANGIIPEQRFRKIMQDKNIRTQDIETLVLELRPQPES